jgi:myo-inositol 2-dehydrogenase/D-chiro-inositol 1-dehydrogenase
MRIGVVGVGRIGSFHASSLAALVSVDDLVVTDVDEPRGRAVAESLGARWVGSLDELFARGLDGVVVATNTGHHPDVVDRCLAERVPTFCEKPLSLDLATSARLVDAQATSDVPVQIGFQRRFDEGYGRLRAAIDDGSLGRVQAIRLISCDRDLPPDDYVPTSGGIFRDMHIHDFDVIRFLTGREVVSVQATGVARDAGAIADHDDFDNAITVLRLDDDALVTVSGSRANGAGYDARAEVAGSLATVAAGFDDRAPIAFVGPSVGSPAGDPYEGFLARYAPAYAAEMAAFVDLVAGTVENPCPPSASHEALLVAEAADRSARAGRSVTVAEVRAGLP